MFEFILRKHNLWQGNTGRISKNNGLENRSNAVFV